MTEEERYQMYNSVEDEDTPKETKPRVEFSGKNTTFTIDGKVIIVPSVHYMNYLEQKINTQRDDIHRLQIKIRDLQAAQNQHASKFNNIDRELDRKVNHN